MQGFACFDKIVWFGYLHPQSEGLFFWFGRVDYRLFHWNGSQHNCIAQTFTFPFGQAGKMRVYAKDLRVPLCSLIFFFFPYLPLHDPLHNPFHDPPFHHLFMPQLKEKVEGCSISYIIKKNIHKYTQSWNLYQLFSSMDTNLNKSNVGSSDIGFVNA